MEKVSWEFIAGLSAIISTLCASRNPLPLHADHTPWGRWIKSARYLAKAAFFMALIIVVNEWYIFLGAIEQIISVQIHDLVKLGFRSFFTVYLYTSARVLEEIG